MKIGFDIDDVFFPTAQNIVNIINTLYPDVLLEGIKTYGIEESYTYIPKYIIDNAVERAVEETEEPIEDAIDVLRYFINNKIVSLIYFITSRPENTRQRTLEQIKSNLSDVPFVIYHKKDKTNTIDRLGLDYFFEDRVDHSEKIADSTKCTPVLFDRPWNQNVYEFHRVEDWKGICSLVINHLA